MFPLSRSFAALWPALAEQCGMSYALAESSTAAVYDGETIGIVDGGGAEHALEAAVRRLANRYRDALEIVAVGARADHRLAAALVRAGAAQYFALPGDLEALRAWLRTRADTGRERLQAVAPAAGHPENPRDPTTAGDIPFPATLSEITRAAVCAMLRCCDGNKSEAARRLGISRPRLQRILRTRSGADISAT